MAEQADLTTDSIAEPSRTEAPAANGAGERFAYEDIPPNVWAAMTFEEKIRAIVADVPQEVWDEIPDDLSYQHDHYIYGGPKRPEPGTPEYEREGEALAAARPDSPVERLTYKDDIPPEVWEAMPIEEKIRTIVASVPAEVWDDVPDDLSERHYRDIDRSPNGHA